EYHLPYAVSIQVQPASQVVLAGQSVSFNVVAVSQYPLSYQWLYNGTILPGGGRITSMSQPTLTLNSVTTNDDGNYRVVITNQYGAVTSSIASLLVYQAPVIIAPPTNTVASVFATASLSVSVTGAPPFQVQWQKNGITLADGTRLSGSASSTLTISNCQFSDDGPYSVVVSNSSGVAISSPATLT